MLKLSGRLEELAKQIETGETMADIGTDHGFLPIALYVRGISPKVVMADISDKALNRARTHGRGVPGISADCYRVGDGLSPIKPGEVDVVVLAGMGAILMTEILAAGSTVAKTVGKFVFQPRNYPAILRHWLYENGFHIVHESLVLEGRHLCEIIVAKPDVTKDTKSGGVFANMEMFNGMQNNWPKGDIRWEVPPYFGWMDDPLADEYLQRKLERERRVRREVQKRQTRDSDHLARLESRIHYLKDLIEKRESDDRLRNLHGVG
jgi:tRNA (adenine22-N1)-methyltransferase